MPLWPQKQKSSYCSSDEEYPVITKEIAHGLKYKLEGIAGYPKDSLEQLQSFGINILFISNQMCTGTFKNYFRRHWEFG